MLKYLSALVLGLILTVPSFATEVGPGSTMARDAGNASLPTARTNLGLGTASDVTFHTLILQGFKQGDMLHVNNLSGGTAPTSNLSALYGNVTWSTPIGGANNQVFPFHYGVAGSAFADTAEATPGTVLLTANALTGANSLTVASITNFKNGDAIWVQLDTGELFSTLVSGTPSGSSVPISPVMPSQASTNNKVYDHYSSVQGVISTGGATANGQKLYAIEGAEFSSSARLGSSVFFKCVLCASQNSDDVVAADGPWDMMLGASSQGGAVGATTGLGFGPWSGAFPVKTTGTLIRTFGAATVANGVDLTNTTFTGNSFKSTGFSVDPVGQVNSTNLVSSGVLRTTAAENLQVQIATVGQEWRVNSQSLAGGAKFYVHDQTNNKNPFFIDPNTTAALEIGTPAAGSTFTGTLTSTGQGNFAGAVSTGVLRTTGTEDTQIQIAPSGQEYHLNVQASGSGGKFYVHDVTNNKNPFFVDPNTSAILEIGTPSGGSRFTGILNVTANIQNNGSLLVSATAPTIASGGCTTGSAQSVSASNGSAAFEITLGGATCGSTITLTMPAAAHKWVCDAHDITTPATNVIEETAAASTTSVVLTNFVRTTGVAGNFTGADVLAVKCSPY